MNVQGRRRRSQTTQDGGTAQPRTRGQPQRPRQAANTAGPQGHGFQRPYSADGGPGFATVNLSLNGDKVPDPAPMSPRAPGPGWQADRLVAEVNHVPTGTWARP